jgi:hypothetical protein
MKSCEVLLPAAAGAAATGTSSVKGDRVRGAQFSADRGPSDVNCTVRITLEAHPDRAAVAAGVGPDGDLRLVDAACVRERGYATEGLSAIGTEHHHRGVAGAVDVAEEKVSELIKNGARIAQCGRRRVRAVARGEQRLGNPGDAAVDAGGGKEPARARRSRHAVAVDRDREQLFGVGGIDRDRALCLGVQGVAEVDVGLRIEAARIRYSDQDRIGARLVEGVGADDVEHRVELVGIVE